MKLLTGFMLSSAISLLTASFTFGEPRKLDPILHDLIQKYQLPGAVGAIVHGDQLVAIGSSGVRKLGDPAAFLPGDVIHLGSDTKAMTALLIGQLIDQKKLKLGMTMREIYPGLAAKMNPQMAGVTVRQLLDHEAGLPHDLEWRLIELTHLDLPAQRRMAVQRALLAPPATAIGSFSYSNAGYVLLGAIAEEITGKPWEQIMQQRLFDPLQMKTAGFGFAGSLGRVDQPWGHVLDGGKLTPVQIDNALVMAPAGCVHCSMEDWCRFTSQVLALARGKSGIISADTFKQLITPSAGGDYAGGWIITQRGWAGGLAMTHSGSNTTWYCTVWIAPAKDFAVLIAINDGAEPASTAADEGIGSLIGFNQKL